MDKLERIGRFSRVWCTKIQLYRMQSATASFSSRSTQLYHGAIQIFSIEILQRSLDALKYHFLMQETALNVLQRPESTVIGPLTIRTG